MIGKQIRKFKIVYGIITLGAILGDKLNIELHTQKGT